MSDYSFLTKEDLISLIEQQSQLITLLQKQVEELKAEIALLKGGGKPRLPAPDWAKANTKPPVAQAEVSPRKKRTASFVRLREEPTEEVVHTCTECPDCGHALSGGSLRSRRQIIDLPAISVKIVEHLFQERYCGVCRKRCFPSPDLSETAVGQSRFGQNIHALVAYLRCWVHFLRDIHKLTEQFPTEGVRQWCEKVRKVYDRAKAFSSPCRKERIVQRFAFQRALSALATPYAGTNLPQGTLCKRILTFEGELFTFVEYPDVPSENNFAERTIRPRVIARKVSGGTKSAEGSKTMVVLSSLFATWKLRGEEALEACRAMMRQALNKSLPQSDSILLP